MRMRTIVSAALICLTAMISAPVFAEEIVTDEMAETSVSEDTPDMSEEPQIEETDLHTDDAVYDADIVASGDCGKDGDNVKWSLYSDGLLYIYGNGEMDGYVMSTTPWYPYRMNIIKSTIDSGVTLIGSYAFYNCTKLEDIIIPSDIIYINDHAFEGCESLSSVTIPPSVAAIGDQAFFSCWSLATVNLSDGLITIGERVFMNCSALTSIRIPDSVTSIGELAFLLCDGLSSVKLSSSLSHITRGAFSYCRSLRSIDIPRSVEIIDDYAFAGCSVLRSVTIPENVISIGDIAFCDCTALKTTTLPSNIDHIGERAFSNCNELTHIHISYRKTVEEYLGKGDLSTDRNNYYRLTKKGCCYDPQCPMGLYDPSDLPAPSTPTVTVKTAFGGKTMTFGCTDADALIYYNIGSSAITTSCPHVKAGETVFFDTAMAKPIYFKAYMNGKWSGLSKNGLNNVQIQQPKIIQSGAKSANNFKVYTQTKDSYIVYTLNGTVPSIEEGTQKLKVTNGRIVWGTTAVVNIPKGRTIKAIAIRNGLVTSEVMTYTNK